MSDWLWSRVRSFGLPLMPPVSTPLHEHLLVTAGQHSAEYEALEGPQIRFINNNGRNSGTTHMSCLQFYEGVEFKKVLGECAFAFLRCSLQRVAEPWTFPQAATP
jgi:hypothetical protein